MNHAATQAPKRAIVIHGREQALFALDTAFALPGRLLLLSAASAGCFMGPPWWAALIDSLQAPILAAGATDMLDCGASAGRCMEALRIGLRRLVLSPACPQFRTVRRRAGALGAELVAERPACLDLASLDAKRDRPTLLRDWLGDGALP
nr:hypothetical protein [uncultured Lichenicoccus sp.]